VIARVGFLISFPQIQSLPPVCSFFEGVGTRSGNIVPPTGNHRFNTRRHRPVEITPIPSLSEHVAHGNCFWTLPFSGRWRPMSLECPYILSPTCETPCPVIECQCMSFCPQGIVVPGWWGKKSSIMTGRFGLQLAVFTQLYFVSL